MLVKRTHYTPHEKSTIFYRATYTHATRLGRSETSIRKQRRKLGAPTFLQTLHGRSLAYWAAQLGIHHDTLYVCVVRGRLVATRQAHYRRAFFAVRREDLETYYAAGGWTELKPDKIPNPYWRHRYQVWKTAWEQRYIQQPALMTLLCLERASLYYLTKQCGFPEPYHPPANRRKAWYEKQAVIAWLRVHPRYDVSGRIQKALEVSQ